MKTKSLQFGKAMSAALFVLLLSVVGMKNAYAYDFSADCSYGGMRYTLYYNIKDDGSVELTYPGQIDEFWGNYDGWSGFTKPTGMINVPNIVECNGVSYSVTSIGEWAFSHCNRLSSIDISGTVTSIGSHAFYYCTDLMSIGIPNSVTSIGSHAFYYCTDLHYIYIPDSVTSIGNAAFYYCTDLMSIVISNSVTSIGEYAFYNCTRLHSIVIPNLVTSIGEYAFYNCSSLTSIEIPNSVTSIGEGAFCYCSGMDAVYYEGNINQWCNIQFDNYYSNPLHTAHNLFIDNELVTDLVIPETITVIKPYTFYNAICLTSLFIPNSVTSIGNAAFKGCTGLTSMTVLANNPPALGNYVFDQVDKSIPVYIPVGSLQDYRNAGSWNKFTNFVELIIFADANVKALCVSHWDTDGDGELSSAEAAAVTSLENVFYGNSSITSFNELQYFIGLTSIGSHEFYNCHRLTSIKIPNSVTSIDNSAFSGCSGLGQIIVDSENSVYDSRGNCNAIIYTSSNLLVVGCKNTVIPNSVTSIGSYAFYDCTGLTSIAIPNSVTSIGEAAFYGCTGLTTIEIPNSVTSIGEAAFYGCTGLSSMTVLAYNPPALGSSAFNQVDNSIPVYVPCGFLEAYQNTDGWNGFTSIKALCPGEVSVTINPSEGGTVTGTGYYNGGELCVLTATPNPFFSFSNWTENGNVVSTDTLYTFTVTGDCTLEANFYVGSINGGDYIIGNGYTYPCDFLPSHSYYKYALSQQIYTTDELGTAGYIYVIGFYNAGAENTRTYDIYMKPTLKDNFSYADWEIVSDSNLVFSGDVTMQANDWTYITLDTPFAYDGNRNVVLVMDDNTGSYTTSEPLFMRCHIFSTSGAQAIYSYNDYTNYDPSSPPYTCTTQSVKNQLFVTKGPAPTFNVSVSANPTEGGTVTGAGTYIQGRNCTVTATANPGYVFVNWRENGEVVSSNASYSFAVTGYRSLVAQFESGTSVDNIVFADANVKALCVAPATNWDTNGDGELSYAEAAAVTSLGQVFRYNTSISSFDELQYFIGLTSIGYSTFEHCTGLTTIELPNSVTSIGNYAFEQCTGLTSIVLSDSLTSIGEEAFRYCTGLSSMTVWADNPPALGSDAFHGVDNSIPVYVPCGSLEAYSSVSWGGFTNFEEMCDGMHWTPENTGNYISTMALTSIIQIDGVEQYSDQLEVGAFCGTECRGSQMASEFFLTNRYLVMLSIAGENGDELTFKLYDHSIAQELDLTSNCVTFNADGYGTPNEPYELNFTSTVEITAASNPIGAGIVIGAGDYAIGDTCILVAQANGGFQFENWTLNDIVISTNATYEFTVTQPASYVAHFQNVQTQTLSSGWNWYSTYIEQDGIDGLTMLENSIGNNGVRVQSKSNGYVDQFEFNGTSYWYGTLDAITNEQMYMVRTNTACNAMITGQTNAFANYPITINNGWNWIGFPGNENISVNTALNGFTPEANDQIKSKNNGYSTYIVYGSDAIWYGTLNTLEPGQGYMYKSNSSESKTLVYQNGRGETLVKNVTADGNAFLPEEKNYAYNMTITAVVELDGNELRSEDYELVAFVGDECRGSVKLMYVEPLDRYIAFLLVSGEQEELLHFALTDGNNACWSDNHLIYNNDGTVGIPTDPAILYFRLLNIDENRHDKITVYPNPSNDAFNIEGKDMRKVEVIDIYGQVIYTKEIKNDIVQINLGNYTTGIYMLRVVTNNGIVTQQIIKK